MPQLRQYPEVTSTQSTDAIWMDRIGQGTVWVPVGDFVPGSQGGAGFDTLALFRAATIPLNVNVIQINGYRTYGDGGAMALYRFTGAGPGVWQSADGAFWRIMPAQVPNWLMFGAYNDTSSHQITSGDISANPQWIGTYTVGTEWSSVAAQECVYYCFASASTVGNVVWNLSSSTLNIPMRVVRGGYISNQTILIVASGVNIQFDDRLGTNVFWEGSPSQPAFYFNSVSYGLIQNMCVQDEVASNALIVLDHNGSPGGLKTQQLSFRDCFFSGGGPTFGQVLVAINPVSSGTGQGDTIIFDNCLMIGSTVANLQLVGQNTLSIIVLGGNMQTAFLDGISCAGATVFDYGGSFENGADFYHLAPAASQFATGGADLHVYSGAGPTAINALRDVRSETNIPFINLATNGRADCVGVAGNVGVWSASNHYHLGYVIGNVGSKGHHFMLVDDGGPPWFLGDVSGSTSVAVNLSATWTTNQWAGYEIWERFTNGFTTAVAVASNTATTATASPPFSSTTANRQIKIAGLTGSSPPSWDSAPAGFSVVPNASGQGFTTTAGSNVVQVGSTIFTNINVGDYVVIIGAWSLGQAGYSLTSALIGKVSAKTTGPPSTITITNGGLAMNATFSLTDALGYYGTGLADNNVTWLDCDSDAFLGILKADYTFTPWGRFRTCYEMNMIQVGRADWDRGVPVTNPQGLFSISAYQQQAWPQAAPTVGAGGINLAAYALNGPLISISFSASCTVTWPALVAGIQSLTLNAVQGGAGDIVLTMAGSWKGPATVDLGSTFNKITHITAQWDPNLADWIHAGTTGPY